jgi:nitrate/nitrite transporter NarK
MADPIRPSSVFQRVRPLAVRVLGFGITAAWTTILRCYLVELAIQSLLRVRYIKDKAQFCDGYHVPGTERRG